MKSRLLDMYLLAFHLVRPCYVEKREKERKKRGEDGQRFFNDFCALPWPRQRTTRRFRLNLLVSTGGHNISPQDPRSRRSLPSDFRIRDFVFANLASRLTRGTAKVSRPRDAVHGFPPSEFSILLFAPAPRQKNRNIFCKILPALRRRGSACSASFTRSSKEICCRSMSPRREIKIIDYLTCRNLYEQQAAIPQILFKG